jgi:dUTP pyrophosphatase
VTSTAIAVGKGAVLRCRRLVPGALLPQRAHPGDAGLDLAACEERVLAPGERASVGCGVAVEFPPGHAGLVVPRSGLALRHGISLVNAPGLIDPGYRGEIRVVLINTDRTHTFRVRRGDRIAQLLVVPFSLCRVCECEALGEGERGERGFGSTGVAPLQRVQAEPISNT